MIDIVLLISCKKRFFRNFFLEVKDDPQPQNPESETDAIRQQTGLYQAQCRDKEQRPQGERKLHIKVPLDGNRQQQSSDDPGDASPGDRQVAVDL